MRDLPHRHNATVSRPVSITLPSWSCMRNGPRTNSGPSRYGVMTTPSGSGLTLEALDLLGLALGALIGGGQLFLGLALALLALAFAPELSVAGQVPGRLLRPTGDLVENAHSPGLPDQAEVKQSAAG